jgi:hypothetical protein
MAPGTVRGWSTGHRAPGPASGWKNEDGEVEDRNGKPGLRLKMNQLDQKRNQTNQLDQFTHPHSLTLVQNMERLELRLGDKLSADLKELAAKNETTKTEIIKRALALYSLASVENDKGARVFIRDAVSERELIAL